MLKVALLTRQPPCHVRGNILGMQAEPVGVGHTHAMIVVCVHLRPVLVDEGNVETARVGVAEQVNGQLQLTAHLVNEAARANVRVATSLRTRVREMDQGLGEYVLCLWCWWLLGR